MYQSLYRKYRPSSFNDVVGQKVVVQTLKNAIKNNKITHAYLFTGPRGTGKTSVAKIFAKTINCRNLIELIPCDNCDSCIQINNKQSIDIIEIDAASNNGVDEIRELNSKVNLVPSSGKYKVYIIDEVHMLTIGAFNALLKTLEEPPSHAIFILATTEPHKIPTTILSRCQRFDFKRFTKEEIVERIKKIVDLEKINIDDDSILEIASLSNGGMRDSLSMLDQAVSYTENNITLESIHEINGTITFDELSKFILNIYDNNIEIVLKKIDEYDKNGKDFLKLTEEFINILRNILIKKMIPNYLEENNSSIEKLCNIENEKIMDYIEKFNKLLYEMKNSNNPKLNFELLIIKIISYDNMIKNNYVQSDKNLTKEKINEEQNIKKLNENKKNDDKIDLEKLKNIRINNTLCNFNKKETISLKKEYENNLNSIIGTVDSYIYSLLIDNIIKAIGNDYIIMLGKTNTISEEYNNFIFEIDDVLSNIFNRKIKSISVSEIEWNKIKEEFNGKKKIYKFIQEPKIEKKKSSNEIEKVFEDILEYK